MQYKFHSSTELLKIMKRRNIKRISEVVLRYEMALTKHTEKEIRQNLKERFEIMTQSIKQGQKLTGKSVSRLSGGDAKKILKHLKDKKMFLSPWQLKAIMYAIATMENNARMGRIVACPTAGASGVLPGALLAIKEHFKYDTDTIINGLLTSAGVGIIIGENATLAGAQGGCQAEIGSAAAMTAAAISEIRELSGEACFHAAALALKSFLGLACDPVGGLVEVPCIKRNPSAIMVAFSASDLTACGVKSFIPFDEVVQAMSNIGRMMSPKLRETGLGGLAVTDTAKKIGGIIKNNIDLE